MDFTAHAFQDGLECLIAAAACGAADLEEVLATAALIQDGDADSWLREWTAVGGAAWAAAKYMPSATRYLHAASYYAAALALIADTDGSVSEPALWERQRECFDHAVALLGGERLTLPYAHTTLPAYFLPAANATRPLVVIDHGGRHATSQALALGGAAAHARGYHWMTFDGPGRQAALFKQGLVLRPDWETVITPVADAMAARADVDAERLGLIGVEHAGYGVARALAFEHRFAAAAVEPGVLDVSAPWTDALPALAREALVAGDRHAFDRELHLAGLFEPQHNALLRRRGRAYGLDGSSPFDLYARVRRYRLGDEVEQITTPLLVRHAHALYERLPGPKADTGNTLEWLARSLG
jgi:hypothetical protein